ncbi:hypothetical protein RJ640_000022 [Escallonia rubra]|uniref:UBN2 domain-containing protein n=1 Tax=Escallonia rubra TaxID=112253 RepID=A0AA88U6Q1_9ASTE|nr:hypothetical protein RJ640_000022 [Escallonia rubra]
MNEYNRVSAYETAKEMWRSFVVTHEETNQVKETKINMLVQQYEAFKMKEHESINEMYSRFTLIINGLKLLDTLTGKRRNEAPRKPSITLPKIFVIGSLLNRFKFWNRKPENYDSDATTTHDGRFLQTLDP